MIHPRTMPPEPASANDCDFGEIRHSIVLPWQMGLLDIAQKIHKCFEVPVKRFQIFPV